MKKKTRIWIALFTVALLATLLLACELGAGEPSVDEAVLAKSLDADYKPVEETVEFSPIEVFHCSAKVSNLKEGSKVTAKWFHGDEFIDEATYTAEKGGSGYVGFDLTPEETWPIGSYKVEVYLEDELAQALSFSVVPPEGATPSKVIRAVTCKGVDEDYKPIEPATVFAPTEVVHCSVNADLGLYSQLVAKWYYQGELLEEFVTTVTMQENASDTYVDFYLEPKPELAEGDYSVEIYLDGQLTKSVDFLVEKPKASLGPIIFAEGVTDDNQPINPATSFPAGITKVYALSGHVGMTPDVEFAYEWLVDGEVVIEDSMAWAQAEQGVYVDSIYMGEGGPLSAGTYELRLYIGGELVQSASFVIEEAKPTPAVEMKTYTSEALGFSIQYPAKWTVEEEEDGATFSKLGTVVALFVKVFPEAKAPVDAKFLADSFVEAMKESYPDMEVLGTTTITAGGIEWLETDFTYTEDNLPLLYVLLSAVKGETGYLIVAVTPREDFSQWQDTFNAMVNSFKILGPPSVSAPPAATPVPPTATSPAAPTKAVLELVNNTGWDCDITLTPKGQIGGTTIKLKIGETKTIEMDPGAYTYTWGTSNPAWRAANGEITLEPGPLRWTLNPPSE